MPERQMRTREKEETQSRERQEKVQVSRSNSFPAELRELETVLRAAEPTSAGKPSLERWAEFNERLMDCIAEAARERSGTNRRQVISDRLRASDLRLKEKKWVALAVVLLAAFLAVAYFVAP